MDTALKPTYLVLHNDIMAVEANLAAAAISLRKAAHAVNHVFEEDRKALEEGFGVLDRGTTDTIARSSLSTGIAMLENLIDQLALSTECARRTCEVRYPDLAKNGTVN